VTREESSTGSAIISTVTATAVILGCGLITGLLAARSLGPAGRGDLAAITVWANVLLYAGTLGLPEAVAFFAAADRGRRVRIWTTGQAGALVLGVAVTILGSWIIGVMMAGAPARISAVRWFLLWFGVPCFASLCAGSWLQGAGFVHRFNVSRSSVHVVNAVGMALLVAFGGTEVGQFAAVLLIGNLAGWAVGAALGPITQVLTAPPTRELAISMLRYGFRVQLGNWSNAASVRLDQLLLSIFATAASLGLYVVAVTYANVLMVIAGSASLVMLPRMVRHHLEGTGRACLEEWYRRVFWTSIAGAVAVALSAVYVVPVLFGAAFATAVPLVMLLVPATVTLGMNLVLSTAFRGAGRPDLASKGEIAGLVATCGGLAVLLPLYGAYGAAIASLLAYAIVHTYLSAKARAIFGTTASCLYIPRRDDLLALRRVISDTRSLLVRNSAQRRIRAQEL
jgi:O-antigen/teichoic acid export membrane protein